MGTTGFLPDVLLSGDTCELPVKHKSLESSCNNDDQVHVDDDDVTSTMSESSSGIGGPDRLGSPCSTSERQTSGRRGLCGHESDVDSGIVSCQLMENHTASISSSETDSSRDSTSNEQKWRLATVASDPAQCVRFDEQLHLSEENIRRSCRKLFASLYSHRFSYPCYSDCRILKNSGDAMSPDNETVNKTNESGASRPAKRADHCRPDMAKIDNVTGDTNGNGKRKFGLSENAQMAEAERRLIDNNSIHISPKHPSDFKKRISENSNSPLYITGEVNNPKSSETYFYRTPNGHFTNEDIEHTEDQRLVSTYGFRNRNSVQPSVLFSHQQNNTGLLNKKSQYNKPLMHKSLSCTVLPTSRNLSLLPISGDKQDPMFPRRTSDPISISNLNISEDYHSYSVKRISHCIPDGATKNNMVHAYARVVSIVSDDPSGHPRPNVVPKPQNHETNIRKDALFRKHISSPVSSSALPLHVKAATETATMGSGVGLERSVSSDQKSSSYKNLKYCQRLEESRGSVTTPQKGRLHLRNSNSCMSHSQPNFSDISVNKRYSGHKPFSNDVTPTSSRENVSPYKSLTLNHFNSKVNRKSSQTVNEALDQSNKNRFNSLPVLDNLVSAENKNPNLRTKFKRGIHQSDFTLFRSQPSASSSSSSSGKSLLDRIQGFTRSAKSAVQKAFSTERIYRPEREERYEVEGHKLKRSNSFIRGLRERMSKKKRREKRKSKTKLPVAHQAVTQERLNTSWDEPIIGPGSVTHVEGQLLQLNPDGSQVIELTKPPSKPYGFFVARGRIRNSRGVFVSRMRDQETEQHLAGLLGIGDEILEIEGLNVKHADILEVNSLMSQRNSLILTVLPYVCRKD